MKYLILISFVTIFSINCSTVETSKVNSLPDKKSVLQNADLSNVDLTEIKHIAPKGRVQDGSLEDENFNSHPITKIIIANGKDSIPFLINKLDDETEMKRQTIDFWYQVYVGDVALIILNDLFKTSDGISSTIPDFGWDKFLERGNDRDSMSEAILRNYIEKHGRKKIKKRWQKIWEDNKENIYWDNDELCFKVKKSANKN